MKKPIPLTVVNLIKRGQPIEIDGRRKYTWICECDIEHDFRKDAEACDHEGAFTHEKA